MVEHKVFFKFYSENPVSGQVRAGFHGDRVRGVCSFYVYASWSLCACYSAECACARTYPAGNLHHGGERPCARSQRQEAQTYLWWVYNGNLDHGTCVNVYEGFRPLVVGYVFKIKTARGDRRRCGRSGSSRGLCCLQRPMTVHLTPGETGLPPAVN